jgi:hypothetical protein
MLYVDAAVRATTLAFLKLEKNAAPKDREVFGTHLALAVNRSVDRPAP